MKTLLKSIWAITLITLTGLRVTALAGPDLTSSAGATFDRTTVTAGESFTLTMTVNNIGNAASAATKINFYLDTTYSYDPARKIGDVSVPAIAAGGTASGLSFTYTVPIDKPAGTYLIYYWIDSLFAVTEDNENNNVLGYNLAVVAGNPPDLVATSATISDVSATPGESITISLSVKNQGTGASAATKINFYIHKDSSDLTTNSFIGEVALQALAAGATASGLTFTYTVPAGTAPGTNYFLCYWIDAPGLAAEGGGENNNAACWNAITILPQALPDLVKTSASISRTSGFPGESIVVSLDVKNQGTAASIASKVNFYFHKDSSDLTTNSFIGEVALPVLAAGASASGLAFNYTIPVGTAPGTNYFLCYYIDGPGLVTEGDGENNNAACWSAITVLNPVLPDLLSSTNNINPTLAFAGNTITMTVDVANQGDLASGATTIRFYTRKDAAGFDSTNQIGEVAVPALNAGATATGLTSTYTVSSNLPSGDYYFAYWIDPAGAVAEKNDNNNQGIWGKVTIYSTAPDLQLVNATIIPLSGFVGETFTLTMLDVKNQGTAASAATKIHIYFHKDSADFTGASKVGEVAVPALAAGATTLVPLTFSYTVPTATPAGMYYFSYWVDGPEFVIESNENNNQGVWTAVSIFTTAPDLMSPNNDISPVSGLPGDSFTIKVDVKNQGNAAAVATKVYFYLHKDTADYSSASKIGEIDLPALNAGQTATDLTFTYTTPASTPEGNYYFSCWIDAPGLVAGAQEDNNKVFWNVSIRNAPGLFSPNNSISPVSGLAGETFTMKVDVENQGTVASVATKLYFYLHKDTADYSAASKIGEVDMPALNPDQTATNLTLVYTVSESTVEGTYYFSFWIDAPNLVVEGREDNNQGSWTVPIRNTAGLISPNNNISPVSGLPGDSFTMKLDVLNRGNIASVATKVFFYLHKDTADYSAASKIGEVDLPALNPDQTVTNLTFVHEVPENTPEGNYVFSCWIDALNLVEEGREDNNQVFWTVPISNAAGLSSTNNSITPVSGLPGDTFTMKVDVHNRGNAASVPTKVYFYLHKDTVDYSAGSKIGEVDLPALNPDQTATDLTLVYTVPGTTPEGTYFFSFWIDAPNLVVEAREDNNQGSWSVPIRNAPGLFSPNNSISPVSGLPGDSFTMKVDVKNQGTAASVATKVYFYFHKDTADYTSAFKIGEVNVPALNPDQTATNLTLVYAVPASTPEGSYFFSFWIDAPNLVLEGREDNNQGAWTVPIRNAADLLSSNNSISPVSGLPGDTFTMKVDVWNRGSVASVPTKVFFYLHKDTADYGSASKIGEVDLPAMIPGQTNSDVTLAYAVPASTPEGNYYFSFWIDAPGLVVEGLDDDNQGFWLVPVLNAAGLYSPNNSITPASGLPGDSFAMKVDVKNRGKVASAATKVYFYLHKDTADYSSSSKIGEVNMPAINPGQTIADLTFSYTVPANTPEGDYYFSYWVDAPNLVAEGREDDNQGVWNVAVRNAADLVSPNNAISPLSGVPGDTFTMTLDVKNRGIASSGAATVRFYLHKDTADYTSASSIGEIAVPALAAGSTASGLTFSFTVPVSTAIGNYFFSYWIDAPGLLLEGNEENNQGFWANIPILNAADLFSPNNSVSPISGLPGDSFTLKLDVENRGNAASAASEVFFYLHKDTADYSSASKIGEVNLPALDPGQVQTNLTLEYTVPVATPEGSYFFSYSIDALNLAVESRKDNNQGSWNVPIRNAADLLSLNNSISPLSGVPGDTFTMSVDVKNRGTASAVATTVRFYFHKDAADYSSASQIGEVSVPALAAGATASGLTFSYAVPASTPAGNYFFSYWLDGGETVLEANEENNRGAWNTPIVNAPDLVSPNNSIIPTSGFAGERFTMTLDVKNQGTTASDASKVHFYMHKDTTDYSAASQIGEIALPPLAAGATASGLTFSYTVPLGTAGGNYQFCYWIDAPGLVVESREENNQSCWVDVEILSAPDLLPMAARISPATGQAGSALNLIFDVKNQGNKASPAGTISIYVHKDTLDYSTNSWIGETALPALNAGATASGLTFAYSPPMSTVPGDYQFCLWIDATGLIAESVENNNGTCASLVPIHAAPPQITVQPKSLYTKVGRSVTFNLVAIGTSPLSYQWQYNGANITNAVNATLTLNNVLLNWTGQYRAIVTNSAGSVTSDEAALTVYVHEPALLTSVTSLPDGKIQMLLTGEPALNYQVQISSNLTAWTLWTNVVLTNGSRTLTDSPASGIAQRFYRAMESP